MSVNVPDPATMDPREFAQLVKKTPADDLKQVMQSERRTVILDEIFARMAGLFRPDRAGSTNAVIHWIVGDRPDGGADPYELVIADGACALSPKPEHAPKLAPTAGSIPACVDTWTSTMWNSAPRRTSTSARYPSGAASTACRANRTGPLGCSSFVAVQPGRTVRRLASSAPVSRPAAVPHGSSGSPGSPVRSGRAVVVGVTCGHTGGAPGPPAPRPPEGARTGGPATAPTTTASAPTVVPRAYRSRVRRRVPAISSSRSMPVGGGSAAAACRAFLSSSM